jgi:hypothetical protein
LLLYQSLEALEEAPTANTIDQSSSNTGSRARIPLEIDGYIGIIVEE